ncbi:Os11g0129400 [Oryza sativa Japonica Group]|uniref:Os11g0129400 protein n=1 Tax=Oryza sativa subsp. japonica TaxID=39947 RepID=A0A0P0XY90_ORYSJ|nr:Os11g0129400 [Oryza sativa Japonica Group]
MKKLFEANVLKSAKRKCAGASVGILLMHTHQRQNILDSALMQFMAKAIGVEPKSLSSVFEGQARGLRMNYYPPCLKADKVLGLSPHTDLDGLTLLLQVNDVQGLQINKDGKWFSDNFV